MDKVCDHYWVLMWFYSLSYCTGTHCHSVTLTGSETHHTIPTARWTSDSATTRTRPRASTFRTDSLGHIHPATKICDGMCPGLACLQCLITPALALWRCVVFISVGNVHTTSGMSTQLRECSQYVWLVAALLSAEKQCCDLRRLHVTVRHVCGYRRQ